MLESDLGHTLPAQNSTFCATCKFLCDLKGPENRLWSVCALKAVGIECILSCRGQMRSHMHKGLDREVTTTSCWLYDVVRRIGIRPTDMFNICCASVFSTCPVNDLRSLGHCLTSRGLIMIGKVRADESEWFSVIFRGRLCCVGHNLLCKFRQSELC